MKRLLFLFCLGFSSLLFGQNNDKDCLKEMRTGTFKYEGVDKIKIVRTKKQQIESVEGVNAKIILDIEWTSNEEYVLTVKEIVNFPGCLKEGDKIYTKIQNCHEGKYNCTFTTTNCGDGSSVFIKVK